MHSSSQGVVAESGFVPASLNLCPLEFELPFKLRLPPTVSFVLAANIIFLSPILVVAADSLRLAVKLWTVVLSFIFIFLRISKS